MLSSSREILEFNSPNKKSLFTILAAATLAVMAGSIISSVISLMQGNLQGADENNVRFIITTHALFIAISAQSLEA